MAYDPEKHHRRSIRMKGFDYTRAGAYFVTVCTQNREPVLNDPIVAGILTDVWLALPNWFPTVGLDEFVVMPTHAHFLLWLAVQPMSDAPTKLVEGMTLAPPIDPQMQTYELGFTQQIDRSQMDWVIPASVKTIGQPRLGDVVGGWKSLVTTVYLDWIKRHNPARRAKFWQRDYYERIVRNDRALSAFRQYIRDNPRNWQDDPDNPANHLQLPFPETIDDYLDDIRKYANRIQP